MVASTYNRGKLNEIYMCGVIIKIVIRIMRIEFGDNPVKDFV